jgi:uncharacterized tellurite resistance protein B-like protein
MLKAIRDFFETHLTAPAASTKPRHTLELATATLVAEVARLDGGMDAAEREAVMAVVSARFSLTAEEAATLVALAEAESRDATDYYQFTSLVRESYSQEERLQIVEMMWRAAYADERLSAHEQHVIRKVADLLYVPHAAYIAAKMRAQEAAAAGRREDGARV